MREKHRLSSGQLLLLELVIAVGFFSMSVAVTMSIFGNAYAMSSEAEAKKHAVYKADDISEIIRSESEETEIDRSLKDYGFVNNNGIYEMRYSEDKYRVTVSPFVAGRLYEAELDFYDESDELENTETEPFYTVIIDHALKKGGANDG